MWPIFEDFFRVGCLVGSGSDVEREVPKNPQRALHLSGSEAGFGGVGKTCPLFF